MYNIWYSPIALALVAAFCYGIGGPIMKVGMQHGVTPNAMLLVYGIGTLTVSFIWQRTGGGVIQIGAGVLGVSTMAVVGLVSALAFVAITRAFALPTGSVTVVMSIVAVYPVFSSIIEMLLMNAKVRPIQALAGCVMVVIGGVLVATSTSSK